VDVVVLGQIARDLALRVDAVPAPGGSAAVRERREVLGGKGANQAVALAQLGLRPELVGVVGDDDVASQVLAQAVRDGIGTSRVVRRPGARTGLVVDVVDAGGEWRYLEDLPGEVLLTPADVAAAEDLVAGARAVLLQLQQPADALLPAARAARGTVVLDGAPPPDPAATGDLLGAADVLRADAKEAAAWAGREVDDPAAALAAARDLLARGPRLVVLGAGSAGNAAAWPGGDVVVPLGDAEVVDTTGGGDAFTAALVAALLDAPDDPAAAVRRGADAAGRTVTHLGGRPAL
jgi:ribokinase